MFMSNKYAFLSNFYPCRVEYNGLIFDSTEAAFQAQKEIHEESKRKYCNVPPNVAKSLGRRAKLRPDWEYIKDQIMYEVVKAKFIQNEDFADLLLKVSEPIVEDNTWGDTYWGRCNGIGKNKLGEILERIKSEIKEMR